MRFKDRVVLVTGGGGGIGRTIALLFAGEGAHIVIGDLNVAGGEETVEMIRQKGGQAVFVEANVTRFEDAEKMVAQAVENWGRLDVLINNAGVTRDGLLLRMSEEDWDLVLDINLKGAFLCTKAAIKVMLKQRSGAIVNIASVVGRMGQAGQANYAASKGGLIALTKSVAKEVAGRNIRVNAVAPGFIETQMTHVLSDEVKKAWLERIPLNRAGTMEDVAKVVAFLASDDASYLTGQTIGIDGGMLMSE
ncbi:MAG TPA: 3-oxoacyl-[acyl-carrier-protein] reductase [Armatimonadota bacterium]|jgi:3-oxoacyl-[acyl-carrier protein] reductase|nr:3-oxoacyl-[acyl-carrier-protein] reductase [Armatimonadota bacterium]HOQ29541.1 3-oxoacyl-[acyl-carrier-protein] reductase [Armatimonadota bacterium]HPT96780.1 3-oxoacyl-[acyl-carrier-protein] reductase [Armatimonadota bacterium]